MNEDLVEGESNTSAPAPEMEAARGALKLSALPWRKSTWSFGNGDCVEFAQPTAGSAAVRDSKNKRGPALLFTAREWRMFIDRVKSGKIDHL